MYSAPVTDVSNSAKSIFPSPSTSICSINLSTCDGGRSARFRLKRPCRNSSESIIPSPLVSNLSNNEDMLKPVLASHFRNTSITSSATKITPHFLQLADSKGTRVPHAPHSPRASSESPENLILHSEHSLESLGITARQFPHSAIEISSFSVSVIVTPIYAKQTIDIMLDGVYCDT